MYLYKILLLLSSQLWAGNYPLPSHTGANPNGKWVSLPQGRNYIFCGDRILFGKDFDSSVKVEYENRSITSNIKKHCKYRLSHIQKEAQSSSTQTALITSSYERLNGFLKDVAKNKKHQKLIDRSGYSYKEIRKKQNERQINQLRISNLLLPILTKKEFDQIYTGSTNNPDFLKAEYSRYVSNLMTQHPAMLYTVDGKFYYFSFNLSKEQLARLNQSISFGGSGRASFFGGGAGSRGNIKSSKQASNKEKPHDAIDGLLFPGFQTNSKALQVAPKGTKLPDSFQIPRSVSFHVPSIQQIKDSQSPSYQASSKKRTARASTSRYKGSQTRNVASSGLSPYYSYNSTNTNKRSYGSDRSSSYGSKENEKIKNTDTTNKTYELANLETKSKPSASVPIIFNLKNYDTNKKYSCTKTNWQRSLALAALKPEEAKKYECIPKKQGDSTINAAFCGKSPQAKDFEKKQCIPDGAHSCQEVVHEAISNICKQYFTNYSTHKDLITCAEVLQALSCNSIPCEMKAIEKKELDKESKKEFSYYEFEVDLDNVYKKSLFAKKNRRLKLTPCDAKKRDEDPIFCKNKDLEIQQSETLYLKPYAGIFGRNGIPEILHENKKRNLILSEGNKNIDKYQSYLTADKWPKEKSKDDFKIETGKISSFYHFYIKLNPQCGNQSNISNTDGVN